MEAVKAVHIPKKTQKMTALWPQNLARMGLFSHEDCFISQNWKRTGKQRSKNEATYITLTSQFVLEV